MDKAIFGRVILGAGLWLLGNFSAVQASAAADAVAQETAKAPVEVKPAVTNVGNDAYVKSDEVFKVAGLTNSELSGEYRLAKYDIISMNILGFPNGIGYAKGGSAVSSAGGKESSTNVNDLQVGPDGYIVVPYVGRLKVIGMTLDEAKDYIQAELSQYIKIPSMTVAVKSYAPRKVYVMGEVKTPGVKDMSIDNLNAYAALCSAGGATTHGRTTRVQVIRVMDGTMYYRQLNMKNFVKKHDLNQNVELKDGDIIYVPATNGIVWSEDVLPYVSAWALYKNLTD